MENKRPGILINIKYLEPRQRKPRTTTFSADTFTDCLVKARNFRKDRNAKILDGTWSDCTLWDVTDTETPYSMMRIDYFAARHGICQSYIHQINE